MILSASRRTDIPCYYAEWFMNRIRAGTVLTRNPMNHTQLSRIPLSPAIVDGIVFWTKDPKNMLPYLDELDRLGYSYYFQFTLTPYDRSIEKNLRPKTEIEDTFIDLSNRVGRKRIVWRYDPIILNDTLTVDYHKEQFSRLCEKLAGGGSRAPYTDTVIVSFVDLYKKLSASQKQEAPLIRPITDEEIAELAGFIGKTAREHGLRAAACCERADLTKYGIERSSCIDKTRIEAICGESLELSGDKNQRPGCGCCESIDIGAYNSCPNGCVYCYANDNPTTTEHRYASHNPNSELLIGDIADGEKITDREVKSNRHNQIRLF